MANYQNLMAVINAVIKTNNRREITGQVLQNVLNTMVSSIGENMQLTGFATPTTNPGQPDQNIFYVAKQAGTYSYFNNITLDNGLSFLMWKNGQWSYETIGIPDQEWVRQNFVSIDFFRRIFRVLNSSNAEIFPNDTISAIDNVEALVAFWSDYYVSALGRGSGGGGGGGGGGDVTWTALADNSDNHQIALSHLTNALTGYATQTWVQSQNYATQLWVQSQSYATQTWVQNQNYASQSWVGQNYISISYFDRLFRAYNGSTLVNHNDTTSTIDNIKAMFGFWTDFYISALGGGGASSVDLRLAQLSDVNVAGVTNGQALVYDSTTQKWIPGTSGLDVTAMWTALGANTNDQINISHLTTALSNYVTTSAISDMATKTWVNTQISGMATQTWVGQNYISIAYFDRLFRAYNGNTLVTHNDTTSTIDNIKAMFGFWTEYYLSALGNGGSIGSSISLSQLADVAISSPTNGQVLVYDSTLGKWKNGAGGGGTGDVTWTALAAATNEQINATHLTTALSGYALTSQIPTNNNQLTNGAGYITSSALSSYLPLSGGTITGTLTVTGVLTTSAYASIKQFIYFRNYNNEDYAGYVGRGGGTINTIMLRGINNDISIEGNYVNINGSGLVLNTTMYNTTKEIELVGQGSGYIVYGCGNTGNTNIYGDSILFCNYSGSETRAVIKSTGLGVGTSSPEYKLDVNGSARATSFIKSGGTSSQFLKADGSVDSNSYLPLTGGTITGNLGVTGVLTTSTYASIKQFIYFRNYDNEDYAGYVGRGGGSINDIMLVGINNYISLSGLGVKLGCKLVSSNASINYINFDGSSFVAYGQGNTGNTNIYGGNILFCTSSGSAVRMFINTSSGNIGIGTNSPSYKLHVDGSIYATGAVTCLSDERFKNVLGDTTLTVEQIAQMPSIRYRWNDNREDTDVHVGSIAQRWQTILPEVVLRAKDKEGTLSIQYGVAALVSSIITARKVVDHERRIAELEKENKRLRELLKVA